MTSSICRGLAATLALSALALPAQALVITQTHALSFAAPNQSPFSGGGSWALTPFGPGQGTLIAVEVELAFHATINAVQRNIHQTTMVFDSWITVETEAWLQNPFLSVLPWTITTTNGPDLTLAPGQFGTFSHTFDETVTRTYTAPAALAYFTAPNTLGAALKFTGSSGYGNMGNPGNDATGTLTVRFISAPESGNALALLVCGLIGIAAVHRRRRSCSRAAGV